MQITLVTLFIAWVTLTISLHRYTLPDNTLKRLSFLVLAITALLALAFTLTPRSLELSPYCATVAHSHWPTVTLSIYIGLFITAYLLLQGYNRFIGSTYLLLIALPLAITPFWIKIHCSGNTLQLLDDSAQGLTMLITFPPVAIIIGGLLLLYLGVTTWRNRQQLWPGLALFSIFLLLQQHAIRDWFRLIVGGEI